MNAPVFIQKKSGRSPPVEKKPLLSGMKIEPVFPGIEPIPFQQVGFGDPGADIEYDPVNRIVHLIFGGVLAGVRRRMLRGMISKGPQNTLREVPGFVRGSKKELHQRGIAALGAVEGEPRAG